MKKIFLNIGIRMKLLIAFISILLLSVVLLVVTFISINNALHYKDMAAQIDAFESQFEAINGKVINFIFSDRKNIDFLETGQSTLLDDYGHKLEDLRTSISILKDEEVKGMTGMIHLTNELIRALDNYDETFLNIVQLCQKRGFKDHGLEGDLRTAIHDVEDVDLTYDKSIMLMLRRHEKDFFLRHDTKYQGKFQTVITKFINHINAIDARGNSSILAKKESSIENILKYQSLFDEIVTLEQKIGFGNNRGYKARLDKAQEEIIPIIRSFSANVNHRSEVLVENGITILVILFTIQFIIGLLLAITYSSLLTRRIKELKNVIVGLSKGELPERLDVVSNDELGKAKKALNNLVKRIETAVHYATDLGNGNLYISYDSRFSGDVLAKSIISMQEKLQLADKKQDKVNWSNQGLAQFSQIFQNEYETVEAFSDKVLEQLIPYTKMNQAAIYMLGDDSLERIATYAYGKKKYISEQVEIGEGLVGQCVLEKQTTFLTDVPDGYTKITSGLGEATPKNVLITPLKVGNNIFGVLEMSSFYVLENYQVEFIEKIASNIGTMLSDIKMAKNTTDLLVSTREQAKQLQQQEEEMKQQMEEMLVTQEDMELQKISLQQQIDQLKRELNKVSPSYMSS